MLVLLDIGGNWTTHLLEDLLKPSGGLGRSSLVIFMPTEADWDTGIKITIAALLKKKFQQARDAVGLSSGLLGFLSPDLCPRTPPNSS